MVGKVYIPSLINKKQHVAFIDFFHFFLALLRFKVNLLIFLSIFIPLYREMKNSMSENKTQVKKKLISRGKRKRKKEFLP